MLAAADGEKAEFEKIYPEFEKTARKEGFKEIANSFKQIAEVEEKHEERYKKLLKNIKLKIVFKRSSVMEWKCRNCGYVHKGKGAPKLCPACKHPQAFYELIDRNY